MATAPPPKGTPANEGRGDAEISELTHQLDELVLDPTHPTKLTQPIQTTQSTQPTYSTRDTHLTQPIQDTDPTQPIQPIQDTQFIQDTQLIQDTDPTQPIQDTDPTQPIQDTHPIQDTQFIQDTQLIQDTDPTQLIQDTDPTQPIQDTDPTQPIQDTHPIQDTQPIQDTHPTPPIQDTHPTQPTQTPPALREPVSVPINTTGLLRVYFDLETTGLGYSHITQIAAAIDEERTFSAFVLPKIPITEDAQKLTGITCVDQQMYHHGKPVSSLTITRALEDFIAFLRQEQPGLLLGHNIKTFDCRILLTALQACNLVERFQSTIRGFADTLPLFRAMYKDLTRYNLSHLYNHFTGNELAAHDAREDIRALQEVVESANPDDEHVTRHSFTLPYIIERQAYRAELRKIVSTWSRVVEEGVVSNYMAEKAAKAGLKWGYLCQVSEREGIRRVRGMLKERLTTRTAILDSICKRLSPQPSD